MAAKRKNRWIYAVSSAIFFLAAVTNGWMILDDGITLLKIIAVVASFLASILLFMAFRRAGSAGN
jgi:hypothetical protein